MKNMEKPQCRGKSSVNFFFYKLVMHNIHTMTETKKRSKDPLTAAITSYLWPFLKKEGFVKSTAKVFSRELNGFVHRIMIDANGHEGKSRTYIIYDAELINSENISGYLLGKRLNDKTWNMSNHEQADKNMKEIVSLLKIEIFPWLDNLTKLKNYDDALHEKQYFPIEPLLFRRAISKIKLGDVNTALENLKQIVSGDFDSWVSEESPAQKLLTAIQNSKEDVLLEQWAESNRSKLKLKEKDA